LAHSASGKIPAGLQKIADHGPSPDEVVDDFLKENKFDD